MTNNRTIEGQAKVCERSKRPASFRRHSGVIPALFQVVKSWLFLLNCRIGMFLANRELANCRRQIVCWQIVSRQNALRQITTNPIFVVPNFVFKFSSIYLQNAKLKSALFNVCNKVFGFFFDLMINWSCNFISSETPIPPICKAQVGLPSL